MANLEIEYNLKFTTASLGCFLRVPLTPKNLALANILAMMQSSATRAYPSVEMQSRSMSNLYDMSLDIVPEVFGNQIVMSYVANFIEPREVLNPDYTYEKVISTFFDIIKKPLFEKRLLEISKSRLNNIMERYYDLPGHLAMQHFLSNWYRNSPNFKDMMWGDENKIIDAELDEVRDFYRKLTHSPAICLGQARDADTLTDLVQPYLDWTGYSREFAVNQVSIPAIEDFHEDEDHLDNLQAHIIMGYGFNIDKSAILNQFGGLLLSNYLAGDEYSDLFKKIREELGAAYSVAADDYFNNSMFVISTAIDKSKLNQVNKIITNSVSKLQQGEIDLDLFKRAKQALIRRYLISQDDPGISLIQMLANGLRGRNMTFEKRINHVKRFTADDLVKFSQELFLNERYYLL
ncbi:putative Zn-dependent peptidase [Lactobacillus colini]|uniref:Zn-dependent peptidase n=1 Tax=Lactobacillus colini TaxID=1819254 RepID=A0ABS4MDG2_9LACO|nr:insulinase family protein [Lactobacillus colini]MBP2057643.1 putative Zn-dependent peptidase [Lactobacillus colini]